MKFTNNILLTEKERVYLIKGFNEFNVEVHCLLLVYKHKINSFKKKKDGAKYNLNDYGRIIYHGYGHEISKKMKHKLGIVLN